MAEPKPASVVRTGSVSASPGFRKSGGIGGPSPVTPSREPEPLSDDPELNLTTPRFVAEPASVRIGAPGVPDLSGIEPEPAVSRGDDGRVNLSVSMSTVATAIGGTVLLLVALMTVSYSLGSRASVEELQPVLAGEANRAMEAAARTTTLREPSTIASGDGSGSGSGDGSAAGAAPSGGMPVTLTPDAPATLPVVDEDASNAASTESTGGDVAAGDNDSRPNTGEVSAGGPAEAATGVDTRQPGLNYMYTSLTPDRQEAVKAQAFLLENGFDSIVEEMTRRSDGQKFYRLWTLVGIPGQGFTTSREKFDHDRAIFDLGNEWLTEHGGSLDFSRESQIGWVKYGG
ncbi:MAG: hypothetical protein AAFR96_12410 [Planctomycetota bacterium]